MVILFKVSSCVLSLLNRTFNDEWIRQYFVLLWLSLAPQAPRIPAGRLASLACLEAIDSACLEATVLAQLGRS